MPVDFCRRGTPAAEETGPGWSGGPVDLPGWPAVPRLLRDGATAGRPGRSGIRLPPCTALRWSPERWRTLGQLRAGDLERRPVQKHPRAGIFGWISVVADLESKPGRLFPAGLSFQEHYMSQCLPSIRRSLCVVPPGRPGSRNGRDNCGSGAAVAKSRTRDGASFGPKTRARRRWNEERLQVSSVRVESLSVGNGRPSASVCSGRFGGDHPSCARLS